MRYLGLIAALSVSPVLAQTSRYEITESFTLGGEGRWDYVTPDPARHRLFIGREDRLMVVDEDRGVLLGEIPGLEGAHGAALAEDYGHGFATSGDDGFVVMFDLATLDVLSRIPAGEDADAILYDEASKRIFSFNGDAHTATVIDAATGKLVKNVELGGKPESGASNGDGRVFVNVTDTSEIVEIDSKTASVLRRWSTAPCAQPVAMTIDVAHQRLFSGCRSGVLAVSDYETGRIVATVPIGEGVDGAGYDPTTDNVFTSNGDGSLTIVHQDRPDRYGVIETLETAPGSRTMGLDPASHRIYVPKATFSEETNALGRRKVQPGSFAVLVIERVPAPG